MKELPDAPGVWTRNGDPWLVQTDDDGELVAFSINAHLPDEPLGPTNIVRFQLAKGNWQPATPAAESDSGEIKRLRTELAAARAEAQKNKNA